MEIQFHAVYISNFKTLITFFIHQFIRSISSGRHDTCQPSLSAKTLLEYVAIQEAKNPNWQYYSAMAESQLGNGKNSRELLADGIKLATDYSWDLTKFEQLSGQLKLQLLLKDILDVYIHSFRFFNDQDHLNRNYGLDC